MACSDCNKSNVIVQPIAAKQTQSQILVDKPKGLTEVTWEGSLLDFDKHGLTADSIIRIIKIADNKYLAVSAW